MLNGDGVSVDAHVDISISADGFWVTGRHVHHSVDREIHDRVSLPRGLLRVSPDFCTGIIINSAKPS